MVATRIPSLLALAALLCTTLLGSCGDDQSGVTAEEYPPFPRTLGAALDRIEHFNFTCVGDLCFVDDATQAECNRELPRLIALLQLDEIETGEESAPFPFIWIASPQKAAKLMVRQISLGNWHGIADSGWSWFRGETVWDDADLSAASVPLLLNELSNPRNEVVRGVLLTLPRLNANTKPLIERIAALVANSADPEIRTWACTALAESRACKRKFSALRAALNDRDAGVRKIASTALFKYLLPAGKLLHARASLRSAHADLRRSAVYHLPLFKNQPTEVLPLFRLARQDLNADVRQQAAISLGHLDASTSAFQLLLALSRDEDQEVRSSALWAMTGYGRPAVREFLRGVRERPAERINHVQCLGRMGREAQVAVPTLQRIVRTTVDEALAKEARGAIEEIQGLAELHDQLKQATLPPTEPEPRKDS